MIADPVSADRAANPASPPDATVTIPPTVTSVQRLPFGELTWENFERLCYRIAGLTDNVEFHARYGRGGQAQQGIDIFVRLAGGRYDTWQVKRYRQFAAADLRDAVNAFLSGSWAGRSERLMIAVQADTADTKLQEAAERHAAELRKQGVTLLVLGADELAGRLKGQPEIVDDFFGRQWAEAFDSTAAARLGGRLDGREFARVRSQLARAYASWFQLLDPGVVVAPQGLQAPSQPSLIERLVIPDVMIREAPAGREKPDVGPSDAPRSGDTGAARPSHRSGETSAAPSIPLARRVAFDTWVAGADQLALIGDAGMGKSLLLRCLALDLVGDQSRFPDAGRRWGRRLPIYVSFARWAKAAELSGGPVALRDVVAGYLQDLLTEDLAGLLYRAIDERCILLLVDGLDEWTEAQAASMVLNRLVAFVATHGVPIVASGRPGGLARIGTIPPSWRHGALAALSADQQAAIARLWFGHVASGNGGQESTVSRTPALRQSDLFLAGLSRDRRLAALARTPLLLLGLLSLSLRGASLPHSRVEAFRQLTQLLLESHPQRRAIAAGDTRSRFVHLADHDARRAALAKLAYDMRLEGADAGIQIGRAKRILRDYLVTGDHSLDGERARLAADEILAVNAESIGLLVEKATGEVGFAHASFEEYLAATHILEWDLPDIAGFVAGHAGDPRWRAAFMTLAALAARAQEVDLIVAAIEGAELDVFGELNRRVLLAGIAFEPARRSRATTARLLQDAFHEIEAGDWPDSRAEILGAALDAIDDPTVGPSIEARVAGWAPRLSGVSAYLFSALSGWAPAPDLAETLRQALRDEERPVRRTAARAIAKVYGGDPDAMASLLSALGATNELGRVAAIVEALYRGWPGQAAVMECLAYAVRSADPTIKFVGASGRVAMGCHDDADKHVLANLIRKRSGLDYWDRPDAERALVAGWPDDPSLVAWALSSLKRSVHVADDMEDSGALIYLTGCAPTTPGVAEWFTGQFEREEPYKNLPLSYIDFDWANLAPFAHAHAPLKEVLVRHLRRPNAKFFGHQTHDLIVLLKDDRLRDDLIDSIRSADDADLIGTYWLLSPLLRGWGRDDPKVDSLLQEVSAWPAERLASITALLPAVFPDAAVCRDKLLAVARQRRVRGGLARAMHEIGIGAEDDEAVGVLLDRRADEGTIWDEMPEIIRHFGWHPRVRATALERCSTRDPPLAQIAAAYESDSDLRAFVLRSATPLPSGLRQQLADLDTIRSPVMAALRCGFDRESNPAIKASLAAAYCANLVGDGADVSDAIDQLGAMAVATGPDMDERRAVAFTGLLILHRLDRFVGQAEDGKPLRISLGSSFRPVPRVMAEVTGRWADLVAALGDDVVGRFGMFEMQPGAIWEMLAPYLSPAEPATKAFLDHVNATEAALGVESLRALARMMPGSTTLHGHCWRALRTRDSVLPDELAGMEAAYLLSDHFARTAADADAAARLALTSTRQSSAVAWCLLDPAAVRARPARSRPVEYGRRGAWAAAFHLAAVRSDAAEFLDLVTAGVTRDVLNIWDMQGVSNRAIVRRMVTDREAAELVAQRNRETAEPSESISLPRLLAAASRADKELIETCRARLSAGTARPLETAGYDCVSDEIRPLSHALRDIVSSSEGL